MNCERAEKLIVDCFLEDIESEDRDSLLYHIDKCKNCKESFFEFRELLKNSSLKDLEIEPRFEIIDRLQQIARINSQKDVSLIKKYFRMPVLVPVFGAAMALMIFLNIDINPELKFGNENLPESPEMVASADSDAFLEEERSLPESSNPEKEVSESKKSNSDIERSLVVRTEFSPGYKRVVSISDIDDEFFMNTNSKSIVLKDSDQESSSARVKTQTPASDVKQLSENRYSSSKVASNEELKEDIVGKNVSINAIIEKGEGIEVASTANNTKELLSLKSELDRIDDISSPGPSEMEGKCDTNLFNNDLTGSESADIHQRKEIYENLAECYEHEGEWSKALEHYHMLKELDSGESTAYQERINFIKENYLQQ